MDQQECNVRKHLAGKRVYCSAGHGKTEQFQYYLQKGEFLYVSVPVSVEIGECSEDENIPRDD